MINKLRKYGFGAAIGVAGLFVGGVYYQNYSKNIEDDNQKDIIEYQNVDMFYSNNIESIDINKIQRDINNMKIYPIFVNNKKFDDVYVISIDTCAYIVLTRGNNNIVVPYNFKTK